MCTKVKPHTHLCLHIQLVKQREPKGQCKYHEVCLNLKKRILDGRGQKKKKLRKSLRPCPRFQNEKVYHSVGLVLTTDSAEDLSGPKPEILKINK